MTISVGFLGYGFMGKAHANAISRLPMFFPDAPPVERAIIAGRNEERLERARVQLGFEQATTDWREVLQEVEVLYNLGPNSLHAGPSIAALERGVHVLCEKPLATSTDDAAAMAAAAKTSDARAAIAFNYRFLPAIQLAKKLLQAGDLGEVYHARARYYQDWLSDPDTPWSWRLDEDRAGSGALGDLASHAVDLLRYLCVPETGPVETVLGSLQTFVEERPYPDDEETRKPVTVDDACSGLLRFGNGATGTLEASRCATGHENDLKISIHGSNGSLRFSLERLNELQFRRERNRGYETLLVTSEDDPYLDHWWPEGHVLGWEHPFVHENYEFLSAVATGRPYRPDFEDGYAVQQILEAIEQSARTGSAVDMARGTGGESNS